MTKTISLRRRWPLAAAGAALSLVSLTSGTLAAAAPTTGGGSDTARGIAQIRAATAPEHNLATAEAAGWNTLFADVNGVTCITDLSPQSMGGMGYHYINAAYINSVDPTKPAALVYRPGPDGTLQLAAVEYIVIGPQSDQPTLLGQPFTWNPPNNRYMASGFWSLHVWAWFHNKDGLFAMWNPAVHCRT